MNRSLVRFEYEKSPLHTIVFGGTGTGKTYFIRQNLKLYFNQDLQTDSVCSKPSSLVNHEQSSLEKGEPCYTNHEQSSFTD